MGRLSALKCLLLGKLAKHNEMVRSKESLVMKNHSANNYFMKTDGEQGLDTEDIEEAESSLREGVHLNDEEARALLGRLEYQRGNIEAALQVFDGIDIAAIIPKMKISLASRVELRKSFSRWDISPMSIQAVSLLLEAIYLKAKALQLLGKFKEAAQSCNIILDVVESSFPGILPTNFGGDCKLWDIVCRATEFLPHLWKLAGFPHEVVSSYRRALLGYWNLDAKASANLQKEFAIFLLYGGCEWSPPDLRSQMNSSYIPKNSIEEAILLLLILLRKFALMRIEYDPSIIDHLSFALSMTGQLRFLATQVEKLLPGIMGRRERYYSLALSYLGEGDDLVALNLLKQLLNASEDPNCIKALLLASKICLENNSCTNDEGIVFAQRAIANLHDDHCDQIRAVAHCLLGISLSSQARLSISDSESVSKQSEVLDVLEKARQIVQGGDSVVIYNLSLENAEQRKLDAALRYAKMLVKMEAGSNVKSWILLARILSAEKRYVDAEAIINAALVQTGKWNQGELLQTKAKIQIAQGHLKDATETYTQLLAILQLRSKSFDTGVKNSKGGQTDRTLVIDTWAVLANIFISMSQWRDAEVCILKLKSVNPFSAPVWHATGRIYEAKGQFKDALGAYAKALDIDPKHAPSLVSTAVAMCKLGYEPLLVKSFLTDAIQIDRADCSAWFNLGLLHKAEGGGMSTILEAADCFVVAASLEESAPVEPFR